MAIDRNDFPKINVTRKLTLTDDRTGVTTLEVQKSDACTYAVHLVVADYDSSKISLHLDPCEAEALAVALLELAGEKD